MAGHEEERKFHWCCLPGVIGIIIAAAPLCWSLSRDTQPRSSPCAPGSTKHESRASCTDLTGKSRPGTVSSSSQGEEEPLGASQRSPGAH